MINGTWIPYSPFTRYRSSSSHIVNYFMEIITDKFAAWEFFLNDLKQKKWI